MQSDDQLNDLRLQSREKPLSRRDFMRVLGVASAAGPGLIAAGLTGFSLTRAQRVEAAEAVAGNMGKLPKVDLGKRLGHMKITPVCICADWNRDLYAPALAMGINFVHKAGYWNSMPDEFKNLPRESYYTDITVDSTPDRPDDYDKAYGQVTSSLAQNGLKYYDIFRAHFGWKTVNAFKNQTGTYKAFLQLKKEGKVKYFGVSQHPYVSYPEIIQAEIDSGLIDSMQVWNTYKEDPAVTEIFAKASKAGIGMTAMKIYQNGHDRMRNDPGKMTELKAPNMVGRSLIRSVLTEKRPDGKPIFQTCVTALGNMRLFEENVGAVAPKVASLDGFDLDRHFA